MNLTPTPSDLYGDPLRDDPQSFGSFFTKRVTQRLLINAALIGVAAELFLPEGVRSPHALIALGLGTFLGLFMDGQRRKQVKQRFSPEEIATKCIQTPKEEDREKTSNEDLEKADSLLESINHAAKGDYPLAIGGAALLTLLGVVADAAVGGMLAGLGIATPLFLSTYETQERWQKIVDDQTIITPKRQVQEKKGAEAPLSNTL